MTMTHPFDHEVAIVGAGPAGIGVGVALAELDVEYSILERESIGASFRQWPAEMRLLTPSFPANSFGVRDLNAITPDTSPAFALDCEHPTGPAYAEYLEVVAAFHDLPIETGVDVQQVVSNKMGFTLKTSAGPITARYVIWAAGQYQYPTNRETSGAENGIHVGTIDSWAAQSERIHIHLESVAGSAVEQVETGRPIAADGSSAHRTVDSNTATPPADAADVVVIGGYESGIDAALSLGEGGISVLVLDEEGPWQFRDPDPSEVLSPRTNERLAVALEADHPITLRDGARVEGIEATGDGYDVVTTDGKTFHSRTEPILATGFEGSLGLISEHIQENEYGHPALTDRDESAATPGLFLAGPQVAHDGQLFCFIYKFRQRFPVVAETIGERLEVDTSPLDYYREAGMFLEDLSCCEPEYCDC